jgi:hypothetical protein
VCRWQDPNHPARRSVTSYPGVQPLRRPTVQMDTFNRRKGMPHAKNLEGSWLGQNQNRSVLCNVQKRIVVLVKVVTGINVTMVSNEFELETGADRRAHDGSDGSGASKDGVQRGRGNRGGCLHNT